MSEKIHIQHVLLSLQPGGLENGVVNVVNRLDRGRFRSSICCLKQAGEFAQRLRGDVGVHEMHWQGGNNPLFALKLARLFRRTGTDIVHTRNAEAFFHGYLGARLAGVRGIIHSEHGRTFDDRALRFRLQQFFSRGTDAIFSVSGQLKGDLVKYIRIPPARIQVLYNGVDFARFAAAERDAVRAEWRLRPGDVAVGSVGRLVPVKNYPLLLRAVKALGRDDVVLVLVGDGPERAALAALAESLGMSARVRLLGHREDIPRLLGALDVFVLPSVSEGMSNTLLEAMAAGVAVVASKVGGNPEIVHADAGGLLFDSGDEAGLAARLRQLLDDAALRARLAAAGRERVLKDFTIDAMIARYEALYQSVYDREVVRGRDAPGAAGTRRPPAGADRPAAGTERS